MKIHMVKKGDTLYLIAQKYNVPLEELIKANPDIANPDEIDVGMKVKIPAPSQPPFEMMHQHTVQQGDTLWKLSKAWGIPLSDMIKANPQLKNPNVLLTGEVVNIPKIPPAGSGGAVQGVEALSVPGGIPGKKNTAVMPEAVIEETPAPLPPVVEATEIELPAPLPVVEETPPMPLPTPMPMPMPTPHIEPHHPYPMNVTKEIHEHHLFAQFPMPAVEAQAAAQPCPPEPAPAMAQPIAAPAETSYGYSHYSPTDWSGDAVKHGGYGDISQSGAQGMPGWMPQQAPNMVSPLANMPSSGAGYDCCGGSSYSHPVAGAEWPNPAAMPMTAPAAGWGFPAMSAYPHPEMASPAAFQPTGIMPASALPGFPGVMNAYPAHHAAVSPMAAMPAAFHPYDPCPPYAPYGMPYDDRFGMGQLPPLPTVPSMPQAQSEQSPGGEASSLSLHGSEEDAASTPAPRAKKASASGKSKRRGASAGKAKARRKESLPWIKW